MKKKNSIIMMTLSELAEAAKLSKGTVHAALKEAGYPTGHGQRYVLPDFFYAMKLYREGDELDPMFHGLLIEQRDRVRAEAGLPEID